MMMDHAGPMMWGMGLLWLLLIARFHWFWWAVAVVVALFGGTIAVGIGAGLGKPWALKAHRWLTWHRRPH